MENGQSFWIVATPFSAHDDFALALILFRASSSQYDVAWATFGSTLRINSTASGKSALAEWIAQPGEVAKIREDLLVKLRAGSLVDRRVLIEELARHQKAHLETLNFYDSVQARDFMDHHRQLSDSKLLNYLVLRCGILYEQAYLAWCEEALALLRDQSIE